MTWEWSHSPEAYADAKRNLEEKDSDWLRTVYAEWKAHTSREDDEWAFNEEKYKAALAEANTLTDEQMINFIWEQMSELANCTNGGHEAHCCPFGCHMVPFHYQGEDDEESAE